MAPTPDASEAWHGEYSSGIAFEADISDCVCGDSAALTQDGTVYTWGSNDSCQLGRQLPPGNIHDETPTPVAGPGVRPPEGRPPCQFHLRLYTRAVCFGNALPCLQQHVDQSVT